MTPNQYRQGGLNVTITYATLETPVGIDDLSLDIRATAFQIRVSSPFRTVKFSPKPKWRPGSVTPTPRGPSRTPAPRTGGTRGLGQG